MKVIGLGKEQVLHYASSVADMMSTLVEVAHKTCKYTKEGHAPARRYFKRQHAKACNCLDDNWACLTQAMAAYKRRNNPEADE